MPPVRTRDRLALAASKSKEPSKTFCDKFSDDFPDSEGSFDEDQGSCSASSTYQLKEEQCFLCSAIHKEDTVICLCCFDSITFGERAEGYKQHLRNRSARSIVNGDDSALWCIVDSVSTPLSYRETKYVGPVAALTQFQAHKQIQRCPATKLAEAADEVKAAAKAVKAAAKAIRIADEAVEAAAEARSNRTSRKSSTKTRVTRKQEPDSFKGDVATLLRFRKEHDVERQQRQSAETAIKAAAPLPEPDTYKQNLHYYGGMNSVYEHLGLEVIRGGGPDSLDDDIRAKQ